MRFLIAYMRRVFATVGVVLLAASAGTSAPSPPTDSGQAGIATIKDIQVQTAGDGVRIVLTADRIFQYHTDQAINPHRVFFDLAKTQVVGKLNDKALAVGAAGLDRVRIAQHETNSARLVLYIREEVPYSVSFLSNPPRLVIEAHTRPGAPQPAPLRVAESAKASSSQKAAVAPAVAPPARPPTSTRVTREETAPLSAKPASATPAKTHSPTPTSVSLPSFAHTKPPELQGGAGMNVGNPRNGGTTPAAALVRGAAQRGDPEAQFRLGNLYVNGVGVERNMSKAAEWYRRAAEQGSAVAQNNLGVMYANGWGVPQNYREALKWFVSASGEGNADAESNLGAMFLMGRGVAVNEAEASFWLKRAAQQGVAEAEYSLGTLYFNGRGIAQNDAEALAWFRKAAARGYVPADVALGKMYLAGRGVAKDYGQAMAHFRSAADRSSCDAAFQIALLYLDGHGVVPNQSEALTWLRKAAEHGSSEGQFMLGQLYRDGKAGATDLVTAYAWFAVAAASGDENAKQALDGIAPKMTMSQIAAGQRQAITLAARVFPATHSPGGPASAAPANP